MKIENKNCSGWLPGIANSLPFAPRFTRELAFEVMHSVSHYWQG